MEKSQKTADRLISFINPTCGGHVTLPTFHADIILSWLPLAIVIFAAKENYRSLTELPESILGMT